MFAMLRHYAECHAIEEVMRRVREGLVPILRAAPGFRAYYALAGAEDGRSALSVSVFADREALLAANDRARAWVGAQLRALLPSPPEIVAGRVLHPDMAPSGPPLAGAAPPAAALHAAVWTFDGAAPAEETEAPLRAHVLPLLRGEPRCHGLYAFRAMEDPSRAVHVLLFDGPEAAAETHARVCDALRAHCPTGFPAAARTVGGRVWVAERA
jgi:hypothetical protein